MLRFRPNADQDGLIRTWRHCGGPGTSTGDRGHCYAQHGAVVPSGAVPRFPDLRQVASGMQARRSARASRWASASEKRPCSFWSPRSLPCGSGQLPRKVHEVLAGHLDLPPLGGSGRSLGSPSLRICGILDPGRPLHLRLPSHGIRGHRATRRLRIRALDQRDKSQRRPVTSVSDELILCDGLPFRISGASAPDVRSMHRIQ